MARGAAPRFPFRELPRASRASSNFSGRWDVDKDTRHTQTDVHTGDVEGKSVEVVDDTYECLDAYAGEHNVAAAEVLGPVLLAHSQVAGRLCPLLEIGSSRVSVFG